MSFDNSRFTFDPWKNYSGVIMEQGRVQLDADWNEWLAEVSRRIQAGTLDIMGHAAYPPTTPSAFLITATSGTPNDVTIGCGRIDRKSTRLNSSHLARSRMPSSA